jgi:DNA-binding transcriptional MocR family regulator
MREVCTERLSVLLREARPRLAGLLGISNFEAGFQTAGWLCGGTSAESVAAAAAERNVDVTPTATAESFRKDFSWSLPPLKQKKFVAEFESLQSP